MESLRQPDRLTNPRNKKLLALALASTAFLSGCGANGRLEIVSGVPVQVDYKMAEPEYDPAVPAAWPMSYYLGLEQCQADIDATLANQPIETPHFDPATNAAAPDCIVKRVEVAKVMYDEYQQGQVVTFTGTPGQPIGRIR